MANESNKKLNVFAISNENNKVRFNNEFYTVLELVLSRRDTTVEFGFTISGYCPCHVEQVAQDSLAMQAGLVKSDLIMKINNVSCCRATLKTVHSLLKSGSGDIKLTVYRLCCSNKSKQNKSSMSSRIVQHHQKPARKFLSKLFKPSIKWLSCAAAAPLSLLPSKCTDAAAPLNDLTLNQTYYTRVATVASKQSSASQLTTISSSHVGADTGYETLSRHEQTVDSNDYTIETVTNTTNSYSDCDLTVAHRSAKEAKPVYEERFNEAKTQLIGELIEMEANFVSYLSVAVAQLARPLRGFFMKQQDYFVLFQNIEKILIISENFLRSMDKWSALDLYTRIGQLYTQKLNLFREAFTIYAKGHAKSKSLLNELKSHSKQFRLFLNEAQSDNLTLSNLIDLPLIHINETLNCFKQIRRFTCESKRNPSEAPHIDSVIFELRKILTNSSVSVEQLNREILNQFGQQQLVENQMESEDEMADLDEEDMCYQQDITTGSMFMSTTVNNEITIIDSFTSNDDESRYIAKQGSLSTLSTTSSLCQSNSDLFYSTHSN